MATKKDLANAMKQDKKDDMKIMDEKMSKSKSKRMMTQKGKK